MNFCECFRPSQIRASGDVKVACLLDFFLIRYPENASLTAPFRFKKMSGKG